MFSNLLLQASDGIYLLSHIPNNCLDTTEIDNSKYFSTVENLESSKDFMIVDPTILSVAFYAGFKCTVSTLQKLFFSSYCIGDDLSDPLVYSNLHECSNISECGMGGDNDIDKEENEKKEESLEENNRKEKGGGNNKNDRIEDDQDNDHFNDVEYIPHPPSTKRNKSNEIFDIRNKNKNVLGILKNNQNEKENDEHTTMLLNEKSHVKYTEKLNEKTKQQFTPIRKGRSYK